MDIAGTMTKTRPPQKTQTHRSKGSVTFRTSTTTSKLDHSKRPALMDNPATPASSGPSPKLSNPT